MPQFTPSAQKTAVAPISMSPAGLSCEAELFLGPNDVTKVASSGLKPFLSTGSPQQVTFLVTMPATPGTYHVYVDVRAGGQLILAYIGSENVVIASLGLTFGAPWGDVAKCSDPSAFRGATVYVTVNNPNAQTITKRVYCRWSDVYPSTPSNTGYKVFRIDIPSGNVDITYLDVTLLPGETKTLTAPRESCASDGCGCTAPLFSTNSAFYFWWEDEDGNESPAILL